MSDRDSFIQDYHNAEKNEEAVDKDTSESRGNMDYTLRHRDNFGSNRKVANPSQDSNNEGMEEKLVR